MTKKNSEKMTRQSEFYESDGSVIRDTGDGSSLKFRTGDEAREHLQSIANSSDPVIAYFKFPDNRSLFTKIKDWLELTLT
jgi:hypothetical protein